MQQINILLVIDVQNDFCMPEGALYVNGAEQDVKKICRFIECYGSSITEIVLTQDEHQVIDISHQAYWKNDEGINPNPYTTITLQDVKRGLWIPLFGTDHAIDYLEKLEQQGEFVHTIWPEHCIVDSKGAAIVEEVMDACKGKKISVVKKGLNPHTEHFGALRANIPLKDDIGTALNEELVAKLLAADNIYVCGEAKSHCVAYTIKQMCEIEGLMEKTILLEDACSNIQGFEKIAESIYRVATEKGLKRSYTTQIKF